MPEEGLTIAGIGIAIDAPPSTRDSIRESYGNYWGPAADLSIELVGDLAVPARAQAVPTIRLHGETLVLEDGRHFRLELTGSRGRLEVGAHPGPAGSPQPFGLHVALRSLIPMLLPRFDGCLVHACGVALEGRGLVFFGRSGAGKSTVARAFPRDVVFSDELVAVRREPAGVRLHSTPFFGELVLDRRSREAPLHAALSLVQAPLTSVAPLDAAEAMSRLVACVALPVGDLGLEAEAFRVAADLVPATRWLQMRFERTNASIRRAAHLALA